MPGVICQEAHLMIPGIRFYLAAKYVQYKCIPEPTVYFLEQSHRRSRSAHSKIYLVLYV